ncbi:cupin domain-containing protein [Microbulbifer rhizosphaerae]|uniref:Quercetin dioxygenase-like cupin family protein n=1 Tax=Microbulbifer rhizosphaerae TaxID=1562603 RepID=A0A7W4WEZ3_9GAMM|nr:cupin domain-containing protein [Microbulbifer rhizosphaerae]MBB3062527.1 quercetin dioxygenase-like cupin family protein [Microbulbifer rhizosphaerae]
MEDAMRSIFDNFVVISPEKQVVEESNDSSLYERLGREYDGFKGHELISAYEFGEDWATWEMHPKGDEVVILLSGKVHFRLQLESGEELLTLENSGDYIIVPKGVWHTAKVDAKAGMIFITPGEGTQHKPA